MTSEGKNMYARRRNINRGYMHLEAWRDAQDLVKHVAEVLERRNVSSFKFCYIALGSLGELMSRMVSLVQSGLLSEEDFEKFDEIHFKVENKLIALVRSLEVKRNEGTWIQELHEPKKSYNARKSRKKKP